MAEWSVFIIVLELRNDENYDHIFNFNKLFIITLSSHYNYNELLFPGQESTNQRALEGRH